MTGSPLAAGHSEDLASFPRGAGVPSAPQGPRQLHGAPRGPAGIWAAQEKRWRVWAAGSNLGRGADLPSGGPAPAQRLGRETASRRGLQGWAGEHEGGVWAQQGCGCSSEEARLSNRHSACRSAGCWEGQSAACGWCSPLAGGGSRSPSQSGLGPGRVRPAAKWFCLPGSQAPCEGRGGAGGRNTRSHCLSRAHFHTQGPTG